MISGLRWPTSIIRNAHFANNDHVEHYRPKSFYYWLAFSWDNLLIACPTCNQNKKANFPLAGLLHCDLFAEVDINLQSHLHDAVEQPYFINPEVIDPSAFIYFHKDGRIDSNDPRFCYTIWTCKIDRKYLNGERKEIFDDFRKKLRAELQTNLNIEEQRTAIRTIINLFKAEALNPKTPFLAFRKYFMDHWLKEAIKDMIR